MKVIGYTRVSAQEHNDPGLSLSAQAQKIQAYCEIYDLELVDIIGDTDHSGRGLDRPGIEEVVKRLKDGEAEGVVVTGLDRLARSMGDLSTMTQEYFGENSKLGAKLITVKYIYDNIRKTRN